MDFQGNWIPTSKRQPNADDFKDKFKEISSFLVTRKGNIRDLPSERYTTKACYNRVEKYWFTDGVRNYDISNSIVAWGPLPNSYTADFLLPTEEIINQINTKIKSGGQEKLIFWLNENFELFVTVHAPCNSDDLEFEVAIRNRDTDKALKEDSCDYDDMERLTSLIDDYKYSFS